MLSHKKINAKFSFQPLSREKAFPFIFRLFIVEGKSLSGSLTVECALALPLFFLALVMVISFMNAIGFQIQENLELSEKARKTAMSAYGAESFYDGEAGETAWIDLSTAETYTFPVSLLPVKGLNVALRARVYPWIGERSADGGESGSYDKMVYVSDNEAVYHTCSDCTHLNLTIIMTTTSEVGGLRNEDGKRYKPCQDFPKNYKGVVYVTSRGEFYYPSQNVGSLTRHVRMIRLSEAGGLSQCSRCAGRSQYAAG